MNESRRKFMRTSACGLTGAALLASMDRLNLVNAMVQQQTEVAADYRALVCIFLSGGTDCNNMVIPFDGYNNPVGGSTNGYDNVRGGGVSGLAVLKTQLLQITPSNTSGVSYGFHPNLSPEAHNAGQAKGFMDVWNAGKLAVLCNVGSLVQPITRTQYAAGIGHPYQLFSHSDQVNQQMSSIANTTGQTGWGGRIADKTNSLNGPVALPMNISLAGTNLFSTGITSRQLAIGAAPTLLANVLNMNWNGPAGANPFNNGSSFRTLLGFDQATTLIKASTDTTSSALTADAALNAAGVPALTATFPNTSLGNQLKQVANLIKIKTSVGFANGRQIFFCSVGGFDTHTNETGSDPTNPGSGAAQSGTQGGLLTQVSQAMRAFYDEMVAQGLSNNVTQFTISDFARTLQPSGSGAGTVGTDHAWGTHAFIMGGAVVGGAGTGIFYGSTRPDGTGLPYGFPTLQLGGPDDTTSNRGQWIPTTSIDQYAATLANWYGLSTVDRATVFPSLSKFATPNLGFLG
jgi:uncharacterized protein (DUF1501 family)